MAEKKWWNNPWTCGVGGCCFGCVAIPLIMVGIFGFGVVGMIGQSGIYQDAADLVRSHPAVIERLGEPLDVGWPRDISINFDDDGGQAKLRFPVSGPNGSGTVRVEAERDGGTWEYRRMILYMKDSSGKIDLLAVEGRVEAAPTTF